MITEQRLEQIQKQIRDCSCSLDDDESRELFRLARLVRDCSCSLDDDESKELFRLARLVRDCSCSLDDDESKELFRLARLGIRYENATEPFLATLVTIQLKCEDEHQNVARALEIAIAAFRIALAQLPKQGEE